MPVQVTKIKSGPRILYAIDGKTIGEAVHQGFDRSWHVFRADDALIGRIQVARFLRAVDLESEEACDAAAQLIAIELAAFEV